MCANATGSLGSGGERVAVRWFDSGRGHCHEPASETGTRPRRCPDASSLMDVLSEHRQQSHRGPEPRLARAHLCFLLPERVRAAPAGCVLTDNESVRLIHRKRPSEDPLEEDECYDHSYGEHLSDHVELVRLEPAGVRVEIPVEVEPDHHVTTERLKGQFEQRLAARTRRSPRPRP